MLFGGAEIRFGAMGAGGGVRKKERCSGNSLWMLRSLAHNTYVFSFYMWTRTAHMRRPLNMTISSTALAFRLTIRQYSRRIVHPW